MLVTVSTVYLWLGTAYFKPVKKLVCAYYSLLLLASHNGGGVSFVSNSYLLVIASAAIVYQVKRCN